MKSYRVLSRAKVDSNHDWIDEDLLFNTEEEALDYIKTQAKCFEYKIVVE